MPASFKPAGPQWLRNATVTLTSAQIKAPHGTAEYTLIAAPGAGRQIVLLQTVTLYNAGATAYDDDNGNAFLTAHYGNASGLSIGLPLDITGTGTTSSEIVAPSNVTGLLSGLVNQPLIITNDSGSDFTLGDGTLTISLLYFVINTTTGAIVPA